VGGAARATAAAAAAAADGRGDAREKEETIESAAGGGREEHVPPIDVSEERERLFASFSKSSFKSAQREKSEREDRDALAWLNVCVCVVCAGEEEARARD
jgi:hypothetical protein